MSLPERIVSAEYDPITARYIRTKELKRTDAALLPGTPVWYHTTEHYSLPCIVDGKVFAGDGLAGGSVVQLRRETSVGFERVTEAYQRVETRQITIRYATQPCTDAEFYRHLQAIAKMLAFHRKSAVSFGYLNHRGEITQRHVTDCEIRMQREDDPWYPGLWVVHAVDLERMEHRDFLAHHILGDVRGR